MPPEAACLEGAAQDSPTLAGDVFAFGLLLHDLLTRDPLALRLFARIADVDAPWELVQHHASLIVHDLRCASVDTTSVDTNF